MLNTASFTLSVVGRVVLPGTALSGLPLAVPDMTLTCLYSPLPDHRGMENFYTLYYHIQKKIRKPKSVLLPLNTKKPRQFAVKIIRAPLRGALFMGEEKPDEELMGKRKSSPRLSAASLDAAIYILSVIHRSIHRNQKFFWFF